MQTLLNAVDRLGYLAMQCLDAERAHDLGKWAMQRRLLAPGPVSWSGGGVQLFGQTLPNPLGLAAGFDKNGTIVDQALDYGFGFVEVGSVTFRGGPGNPKPRMFRLDSQTIMNRMGLNGDPAEVVAARLAHVRTSHFGVNIAKTHSPDILGDAAIADILASYKFLYPFGFYTAVNVSCPNTREGRTFEDPAPLAELLGALTDARRDVKTPPLLVKLSPVLDPGEGDGGGDKGENGGNAALSAAALDSAGKPGAARLDAVLSVCEAANVAGYICCNTLPREDKRFGRGGISGAALRASACRMAAFIHAHTKKPVIGCGGVFTRGDLDAYLNAGCTAVQAYNGFVRGPLAGVRFVHRIMNSATSPRPQGSRFPRD